MFDYEAMWSNKQATVTGDSESTLDIGTTGALIQFEVDVGGGATITTVTVQASDEESASFTEVAKYTMGGAKRLVACIPANTKRFVKLVYAGSGSGTITAGIVAGGQTNA